MSGAMDGDARTLVIGPSWLGDCVMVLPALQRYVAQHGGRPVAMVAKPAVAGFWELSDAVGDVITLEPGLLGVRGAASRIREGAYGSVVVLPNSWRSGLLGWLGRVPERRGAPGHARGWMLTERVRRLPQGHQAMEVAALFGVDPEHLPAPSLRCPDGDVAAVRERLLGFAGDGAVVAVVPGAARGGSKRWPIDSFREVVEGMLHASPQRRVVVCGTQAEQELCEQLVVDDRVVNAAGRTSLRELAALFAGCVAVICNDSGGMHLAAAMGTPVVAIFGLTDPARTGPLGTGHRVVVAEGVSHDRRIARDDAAAGLALRSIRPERVLAEFEAACRGQQA